MAWRYSGHTADYYILKTFLWAFVFVFLLFTALAFVLILFQELDEFRQHDVAFGTALVYVLLSVPHEVVKATPIVVVLAVVMGIGNLVRHNEMLMLYIAGYTPVRLAVPLAVMMSGLIGLLFWLNENVCGPFAARAHELREIQILGTAQGLSGTAGIWMHGEPDHVYRAREYLPYSRMLEGLSIFIFKGENRTLSERIDAQKAVWMENTPHWRLEKVRIYQIKENETVQVHNHEQLIYPLNRLPSDFGSVIQDVEKMSHGDLRRIVDDIREAGENPLIYLPDLRIKEAFPFAVLFLGLLAYAMVLKLGSGGRASGIGTGLVAVIFYFMTLSLGKSFAQTGTLSPWIGAWAPNVICFALTVYVFNRLRYEI
ncbi:MAG TPA: LptF/LptG family permease [bacterium]|mgnify:FL=1|nr:LptF/LptG family permease [bacterium]